MDVQHPCLFQTATHERCFKEFSSILEITEEINKISDLERTFHLQCHTSQIGQIVNGMQIFSVTGLTVLNKICIHLIET